MVITDVIAAEAAAVVISKPGGIHVTRVAKIKEETSRPRWGLMMKRGRVMKRKMGLCQLFPGFWPGARLCVSGRMPPSLCHSQVRKKTHYQLQLQDARRKKKRKRAAISAARHENKPTEKSALMSTVYAAGCVGWTLPHIPKEEEWIIPQVRTRMVTEKLPRYTFYF